MMTPVKSGETVRGAAIVAPVPVPAISAGNALGPTPGLVWPAKPPRRPNDVDRMTFLRSS
jgi:hypothetical protein